MIGELPGRAVQRRVAIGALPAGELDDIAVSAGRQSVIVGPRAVGVDISVILIAAEIVRFAPPPGRIAGEARAGAALLRDVADREGAAALRPVRPRPDALMAGVAAAEPGEGAAGLDAILDEGVLLGARDGGEIAAHGERLRPRRIPGDAGRGHERIEMTVAA